MAIAQVLTACTAVLGFAFAQNEAQPNTAGCSDSELKVDLGYGVYEGYTNSTSKLNIWKGIRFAAPPIGSLRWQAPQVPTTNRTVISADTFGPICPQTLPAVPGATFIPGNEDCLFLNVYAPAAPTSNKLPVLVWIHGGGYGLGDGTQDMSTIINDNNNSFVAVSIQYRLGAFGWTSSGEVKSKGAVNAGFLDQTFALSWVQDHIALFGGDSSQVTISGESAGGSSVMYHALAADGSLGPKYFKNGIAASPYLVAQYQYDAPVPTQRYYQFSKLAGCGETGNVFDCLIGKDTMTLQMANANVTTTQVFGTWPFLPVTDGTHIKELPSVALNEKKVNGANVLVGNNADEGPLFVPPNITTENDLLTWLRAEFPNLTPANLNAILDHYPTNYPADGPKFATTGLNSPTANDVSGVADGQQQRANNILAEATFICPSYWLATAFTQPGKTAYHYQYSVPFAMHASDVAAYMGPATPNQGPDFVLAFRQIWGNFIVKSNPSISNKVANGAAASDGDAKNAASEWPLWKEKDGVQINLNQTGGTPVQTTTQFGAPVVELREPGLKNDITAVNAFTWEGGRGQRCEFWRSMSLNVPQ